MDTRYFIRFFATEGEESTLIGNPLGYLDYETANNYLNNIIERETDLCKSQTRKYVIYCRAHTVSRSRKLYAEPQHSITRYFISRIDHNSTYEVLLTRIFSDEDAANQFSCDLNKQYRFRYHYEVRPMTFID